MRRAFPLALTLAALGTGAAPAGAAETPAGPSAETPAYAPARVIVQYKPGAQRADARDDVDATSARALDLPRTEVVSLPVGSNVPAAVRELEARDDVAFAQPDILYKPESTPNDTLFDLQWGLNNVGQKIPADPPPPDPPGNGTLGTPDADIDAPFAWDETTGSSSVIVGVMDTGVNIGHEDLTDNVFTDTAEASGTPGVDDDSNGKVDDVHGWDFVNLDGYVSDDFSDHGTTVASVIGARGNNGKGTTGVAQQVTLLPLQVVNSSGFLSSSAMVDAIGYAHDQGARIVNMSFGRYFTPGDPINGLGASDEAVNSAISDPANSNILFTASAGNLNGSNQANDNDSSLKHWPSNLSVDHANVLSEANTTNTDTLSDDSSFGATSVDLGAPGTLIAGASSINDDSELYFSEKFDTTATDALPSDWTTDGAWAVTASDFNSQPKSLTDSPAGADTPNSDTSATSPTFDVPADATCTVRNSRKRTLLAGDHFRVEVALDAGSFTAVDDQTGSSSGWVQRRPPATFDTGSATSAQVRFRLTPGAGAADGVYVDDVQVLCVPDVGTSYVYASGTSFATPTTSGAAALLLAKRPSLTASELKTILKATVDLLPGLSGKVATGGRLNVGRAVHELVDPTATTGNADVSTTGVTLHSAVDPTGSPASVHFEFRPEGETDWVSTGSAAIPESSPTGTDATTTLTELTPNATYEYRVVVTKSVGALQLAQSEGGTQSFHVPADFTGPVQPDGGGNPPTLPPTPTTTNQPPTQPIVVPPLKDTTAPRLAGLKVAPTAFLPLRAGASIARALRKKTTPRGATLRFRVSERSSISARVLVRKTGRRKGRSCVAPTRANRKARACVRYVAGGGATKLSGDFSGLVTRRLSGRVRNKALKGGTYRLELTATDGAGNRGRPANVAFRIATR